MSDTWPSPSSAIIWSALELLSHINPSRCLAVFPEIVSSSILLRTLTSLSGTIGLLEIVTLDLLMRAESSPMIQLATNFGDKVDFLMHASKYTEVSGLLASISASSLLTP